MGSNKGQRPPTECDFNFALHYERRDYFDKGFFYVQESNGDYTEPPPIEPIGIFAHPKNSKVLGPGFEPASPSSVARTIPLSCPATPN